VIVPSETLWLPAGAVPVGVPSTSVGTVLEDAPPAEFAGVIVPFWLPEFTNHKNPAVSTATTIMKSTAMPNLPIWSLYNQVDKFCRSAILEPIPKTIGFASSGGLAGRRK
jgi:hypothetical protein